MASGLQGEVLCSHQCLRTASRSVSVSPGESGSAVSLGFPPWPAFAFPNLFKGRQCVRLPAQLLCAAPRHDFEALDVSMELSTLRMNSTGDSPSFPRVPQGDSRHSSCAHSPFSRLPWHCAIPVPSSRFQVSPGFKIFFLFNIGDF